MEKTVCELFAGVGGFRLGLETSSHEWNTVWANQWEPGKKSQHAYDCYCKHFGISENHVNADISQIEKSQIPNHNLLVGGFPCQDYSVARSLSGNHGINGKKGVLWWQIRDILEAKRPPFVLLENVDRLLKSPSTQRGKDFGIMLACLAELGYDAEWRVINAADYGNTQRRRRVFIFAYNNTSKYYKKANDTNEMDIINTEGFFAKTFPINRIFETNEISFNNQSIFDISESFKFNFLNAGYLRGNNITTATVEPIFEDPIPLKYLLEKSVDEKYYLNGNIEKWEYLKGSKKINRTSKTGHCYIFSEGPLSFPDDINKPARTMLTSESSLNRSTHVIEDPQNGRLRLLTPKEAERINGFDDDWTKTETMPHKFRYFCMGNALVVPLITRLGKTLNKIFEAE
ncbi:MAG: DNA-methyltransferase (dcm) [Fusobacteria bacterium]|nr:MAG: DNA-methyltransferase (dcm) [Fusobacteriota bacterium]KAF0228504.1 MAG: DNA-methyltransferase [Fusobacteriota bacterium]